MTTAQCPAPRVDDFVDLKLWHKLPPVQPELCSHAWERVHTPMCAFDGRAWAGPKANQIVSCSGPAEFFPDEGFITYGYCAYHWALKQEGKLFSGTIAQNPKYTETDRRRDQEIVKAYWDKQQAGGNPNFMRG
jgi:hypothetical protein